MAGTTELDQRPVLAENDILVVRRGLNRRLIRGALVLKLAGTGGVQAEVSTYSYHESYS